MNFDGNLCVDPRENGEKSNQNIICSIIPYAPFFLAFPALQVCGVACHFSKKRAVRIWIDYGLAEKTEL